MLNLLLAGVLLSGSVSQSISHTTGHVTPAGGAVVGGGVTTSTSFPKNTPPRFLFQATQGSQTLYRCTIRNGKRGMVYYVRDPLACGAPLPYLWF